MENLNDLKYFLIWVEIKRSEKMQNFGPGWEYLIGCRPKVSKVRPAPYQVLPSSLILLKEARGFTIVFGI